MVTCFTEKKIQALKKLGFAVHRFFTQLFNYLNFQRILKPKKRGTSFQSSSDLRDASNPNLGLQIAGATQYNLSSIDYGQSPLRSFEKSLSFIGGLSK